MNSREALIRASNSSKSEPPGDVPSLHRIFCDVDRVLCTNLSTGLVIVQFEGDYPFDPVGNDRNYLWFCDCLPSEGGMPEFLDNIGLTYCDELSIPIGTRAQFSRALLKRFFFYSNSRRTFISDKPYVKKRIID